MKRNLIFVLVLGLAMSLVIIGADKTHRPGWYDQKAFTASDMIGFVIDSSTTIGYQLKRVVISGPLDVTEASGATNDSDYTAIWICPSGMTLAIDSVFLWALTEGDVDQPAGGFRINVRKYDYSASAYDTLITDNCDAESLAYGLTNAVLSWGAGTADSTKTLDPGDAVIVGLSQDSVFVTGSACTLPMITIKGRLDE